MAEVFYFIYPNVRYVQDKTKTPETLSFLVSACLLDFIIEIILTA